MFQGYLNRHIENPKSQKTRDIQGKRSSIIGIAVNLFLALTKILVGLSSGAISIFADGINNTMDVMSSVVSLVGFILSGKPADREHPYGHARYEYLASFIVSFIILWVGIQLVLSSVDNILYPKAIDTGILMFSLLILSILVKIFLYRYNVELGEMLSSDLLIGVGLDARNDILATSGVLLSMIVITLWGVNIDGFIGLIVSVAVLKSGYDILKTTVDSLIGRGPTEEDYGAYKEFINSYPDVLNVHNIMVHEYGPGKKYLTAHVEVDANHDLMAIHTTIDQIESVLANTYHLQALLHVDPINQGDPIREEVLAYLLEEKRAQNLMGDFRDLRVVKENGIRYIDMDVLIPVDGDKERVERKVRDLLQKKYPDYIPVIEVNNDFHNEL